MFRHPHLEYLLRNVHVPPPLVDGEELGGWQTWGGTVLVGGWGRGLGWIV